MTFLEIDHVTKTFPSPEGRGAVTVFSDVAFGLAQGEFLTMVGHSGCGKSTLLNIIAGLEQPTEGGVVLEGREIQGAGIDRMVVFQNFALMPWLTTAENVALPMLLARRGSQRQRRRRVAELLELFGIAHAAARRPQELSGGEQQRVAIATAVANEPEVLLADEPTGELDQETAAQVLAVTEHANAELGVTVLVVTHDPLVSRFVGRTLQIRDGRTSTEVVHRRHVDASGQEKHVAEEFAVLDRAGRLQLPRDFTDSLSMRDRVRLALETDHIGVWPDRDDGQDGDA